MPDPVARLMSAAERTANEADRVSARFARELAAMWRQVERRLSPIIAQMDQLSTTTTLHLAAANRLQEQFRTVLREAGFDALADAATNDALDNVTARVLAGRGASNVVTDLRTEAQQQLLLLKSLYRGDLLDAANAAGQELARVAARSVVAGASRGSIREDFSTVLDRSESRLRTIYDTTVSVYGRQVEAIQAGDDPETVFAYMGPVDDKTREFCLDHVGRVYTRSEIDDLDNGQMDNVFLTGGGYNCRHVWMEVSAFSELQDLQGSTSRIPEIMDAVTAIREQQAA